MKIDMKKSLMIGGLVTVGLVAANAAFAADSAIWTTLSVSGNISESTTITVEEELRFADATDPSLARQHTDLNLGVDFDVLTTQVGYRNTSTGEHRPYVGVGFSLLTGDLSVNSVTRLELRDWDTLRGRTDLTASASVAGVTPWLTDEVFVDESGVTGNRLSVGVTKGIDDTFSVMAYYLLNTALEGATTHTHVLGLGLGVGI